MATSDISSPYYGMTDAQLMVAINNAQAAHIELRTGKKVVTVAYAQGGGSRSATFQQTDMANLRLLIAELQQALNPGVRIRRRRPITPYF
ncbi:gpW family head-tail joining protein [Paraburkholderia silviterrae]|uniref:Phage head-tail adapter protein n=1 Tax=Paraburkholderia silviterrae TaxID=2528715 RepID=A0A4V6PJ44_9BURK|nr:gpW family head-tail joining protein [Paraburkholderia silviterrae]TDG23228.1 phage head-tail adapter protein [Paraburkholderia silviterrae]